MKKLYNNEIALKTMRFIFFILIPCAIVYAIGFVIDDDRIIGLGTGAMLVIAVMTLFVMINTKKVVV